MNEGRIVLGLVPLYLKLYDDLDPHLRFSLKPIIESLKKTLGRQARVVESGIITQQRDVVALTSLFAKEEVDAVFVVHLAYSPSMLVAGALKRLDRPLVLVSTSLAHSFGEMSEAYLLQNHGIHGVMDLASVLQSMGARYTVVAGHFQDHGLDEKIERSVMQLAAVKAFRNQKIGTTGCPFPMMGDFAIPPGYLRYQFGIKVTRLREATIARKAASVDEEECLSLMRADHERYHVEGGEDTHKTSVRAYLAIKALLDESHTGAYTMNYLDFKESAVPFYAVSRLMGEGYGYAGEGDVLTASLGRPLNTIAGKAMFSEIFCPDWDSGCLIMSHMGEIDPRFARPGERGKLVEKKALGSSLPSLYHRFQFAEGVFTFAAFAKKRSKRLRLVVGLLDAVNLPAFEAFQAPHFVVKPRMQLPEFLEQYSLYGGGHHLYLAEGDRVAQIEAWARLLGIEAAAVSTGRGD